MISAPLSSLSSSPRPRYRPAAALLLTALLATTAACSSSGAGSSTTAKSSALTASSSAAAGGSSAATSSAAPTSSGAAGGQLYVSIGDSYAAGFQPTSTGHGSTTRNGFAYQVVTKAKAQGKAYQLVNFACAGATTTSLLSSPGCKPELLGPGAPSYSTPQATAAEQYVRQHRGQVGLITVSIGGNDITSCALAADPTSCVTTALQKVKTNLTTLLTGLRSAAGPSTKIVGITYPDVFLGDLINGTSSAKSLAQLSVVAFQALINPTLKAAYAAVQGDFVDVTTATGAYTPLTQTTTLAPYGTIPAAVAKVCTLTFYCQFHDIHPRTNGYALIADLVVKTLS